MFSVKSVSDNCIYCMYTLRTTTWKTQAKREGIIKTDLREVGWGNMDLIDLAEDRDRWRVHVNSVMNLRVS